VFFGSGSNDLILRVAARRVVSIFRELITKTTPKTKLSNPGGKEKHLLAVLSGDHALPELA
jgi:hypothetical protein